MPEPSRAARAVMAATPPALVRLASAQAAQEARAATASSLGVAARRLTIQAASRVVPAAMAAARELPGPRALADMGETARSLLAAAPVSSMTARLPAVPAAMAALEETAVMA